MPPNPSLRLPSLRKIPCTPSLRPAQTGQRHLSISFPLRATLVPRKPRTTHRVVTGLSTKDYGEELFVQLCDARILPDVFRQSSSLNATWSALGIFSFHAKRYLIRQAAQDMSGAADAQGNRARIGPLTAREAAASRFKSSRYERSHVDHAKYMWPNDHRLHAVLEKDDLYGEIQYAIGEAALMSKEYFRLGIFMLSIAAEVGHLGAAVRLVQLDQEGRKGIVAPPKAKDLIREAAENEADWRAMVLHALDLVRVDPKSAAVRQKAYQLAKRAFYLTEPSAIPDNDLMKEKLRPWQTLRMFARDHKIRGGGDEAEALIQEATIAGAYDYDDPEACYLLAISKDVKPYSEDWVELMTKAAMAGKPDYNPELDPNQSQVTAADELGKYYLEKYGFYPTGGKQPTHPNAQLGFYWLEVAASAHASQPEKMIVAFLKIAVVCRENGLRNEGLRWLQRGLERLDEFPAEKEKTNAAKREMQKFINSWGDEWEGDKSARWLLGKPLMHSDV